MHGKYLLRMVEGGGDLEEYVSYNEYLKHKLHDEKINSKYSANLFTLLLPTP